MAQIVLVRLLVHRLLGAEKRSWLEKVFITIVWNSTASIDGPDTQDSLSDLLNILETSSVQVLSPSATHAAQVVSFRQDIKLVLTNEAFVETHRNQL